MAVLRSEDSRKTDYQCESESYQLGASHPLVRCTLWLLDKNDEKHVKATANNIQFFIKVINIQHIKRKP